MKKLIIAVMLIVLSVNVFAIDVQNAATNVITYFVMRDQTAGTIDTGVVVANLEMYYTEDQIAESADAFVGAHSAATDSHGDGKCFHVGHGVYRVDWPDAAFDGGIGKRVQLILVDGDAGAFTEILEVQLSPPTDVITVVGDTPFDASVDTVNANVISYLGTAITETAGQIAAAFKKFFDVAAPSKDLNDIGSGSGGGGGRY